VITTYRCTTVNFISYFFKRKVQFKKLISRTPVFHVSKTIKKVMQQKISTICTCFSSSRLIVPLLSISMALNWSRRSDSSSEFNVDANAYNVVESHLYRTFQSHAQYSKLLFHTNLPSTQIV
jgi:hypothetical protein